MYTIEHHPLLASYIYTAEKILYICLVNIYRGVRDSFMTGILNRYLRYYHQRCSIKNKMHVLSVLVRRLDLSQGCFEA